MISLKRFCAHNMALSPVIGEILMVVIVVIIGAIIAAFAFGLGGIVQDHYVVGIVAEQTDADMIIVTFQGGKDADRVLYLNVSVNGVFSNGSTGWSSTGELNTFDGNGIDALETGTSRYIKNSAPFTPITTKKDHVIVVGKFVGGENQIVLDAYV